MDDLLQPGITAYKAGKRDEARKAFLTVVKQDPENERAWGWMYQVSGNDKERIYCLKQMLRINPKNEKANQLLDKLLAPQFTSNPSSIPIAPPPKQVDSPQTVEKKSNNTIWIVVAIVTSFVVICLCIFIFSQTKTLIAKPVVVQNTAIAPSVTSVVPTQTVVIPTSTPEPADTPAPPDR